MMGYPGDVSFDYPYDNILAPNARLPNEGVRTETDSDFLLYGLTINSYTSVLFLLQFKDSSGNYFSSGPIMASRSFDFQAECGEGENMAKPVEQVGSPIASPQL